MKNKKPENQIFVSSGKKDAGESEPAPKFNMAVSPDDRNLEFNWQTTGQMILTFQAPPSFVSRINELYDDLMHKGKLINYSKWLLGKVVDEYSLYLDDDTNSKVENHNFLPDDIHEWIKDRIHQYLRFTNTSYVGIKTAAAWINDYKAGEYNPVHIHFGNSEVFKDPLLVSNPHKVGLVGLMTLKVPNNMGKEFTNDGDIEKKRNGYTEFVGGAHGAQFAPLTTVIKLQPGDFVVFPYDLLHCVYPHFNENETRRTFPTNIDVYLNE